MFPMPSSLLCFPFNGEPLCFSCLVLSCASRSTESHDVSHVDVSHARFSLVFPVQRSSMMYLMPGSHLCFLFNGELCSSLVVAT